MRKVTSFVVTIVLLCSLGMLAAGQDRAGAKAQTTPEALVAALYKAHDRNQSPFFQTKSRALIDRYFERSLADLIWKDAKEANGEIGAIEADPLYNAQDTKITGFTIHRAEITGDKAEVLVTFLNYREKSNIVFSLVQTPSGWKISDIKYSKGMHLLGFYKGEAAQAFFEGTYKVGATTATVKPVKMAFEVRWAKGSGVMMFFFDSQTSDGKYVYASEDNGKGTDKFIFDNDLFESGKFVRADGRESTLEKVK
jgi:Protein of unknown function (DUF3828)